MLDAVRAFEEGVGTIEAIDAGFRLGAGHPMGPLTLNDFVGLETLSRAGEGMYEEYRDPRFATPPLLRKMITAGWYGKKTGLGFYDWSGPEPVPEPEDRPAADRLMTDPGHLHEAIERGLAGGPARHHEKSAEQGKLPVRERLALLLDDGSFAEEALLANWDKDGLGADGVVTGVGEVDGRPVARDGQRPDREGRLVGPEDRREDHPHPGARARAARSRWSTSSTRPGRASPTRC